MSQLVVVCHQIRSPDNLGSIARLMANFGLNRWVLSDPITLDLRGAEKMAVGAEHVLRGVAVAKELPEAIRDCVYAIGTTSREVKGRVMLSPAQAIAKLKENATRGPVALVLGGEKRGLSDEELACCTDVAAISTQPEQPSLNVSQAAAIFFFLWSQQQDKPAIEQEGARLQTVQALEKKLSDALLAVEFLNPQAPQHVVGELSRSLVRKGLTQREAELWLSAFEHVRRFAS